MVVNKTVKPNKQRKRIYTAKLHENQNRLASHLSADLRKKYKKRSVTLRKGDVVKIMRGSHKGSKGKVTRVSLSKRYVTIENMLLKRKDGVEVPIKFNASNLMVLELHTEDEKRFKQKTSKVQSK